MEEKKTAKKSAAKKKSKRQEPKQQQKQSSTSGADESLPSTNSKFAKVQCKSRAGKVNSKDSKGSATPCPPSAQTKRSSVIRSKRKPVQVKPKKETTESSEGIADELGLKPGTMIVDKDAKYFIVKTLGEGGFGVVLKVYRLENPSQPYAMKVEKRGRKHSKLKMEIAILKEVKAEREKGKLKKHEYGPHFTEIFGRGKMESYVYLVMEIVGKSLNDLKQSRPDKVLSLGTAIFASIQCLEAVEDLHTLHFIHRDLKPANYAIGIKERIKTVYILDFGIARKTVNSKNEIKTPRAFCGFKELGASDDVESWFYLLLDLVVVGGLPWRKIEEKDEVLEKKEECITSKKYWPEDARYAKHFLQIIDYIAEQEYQSVIDYEFIYNCLRRCAAHCDINLKTLKLDWEEQPSK